MRAWIARDDDGEAKVFVAIQPSWEPPSDDIDGYYWGDGKVYCTASEAERMAGDLSVKRGHKQQIELTARPIGEAEGGGDGK